MKPSLGMPVLIIDQVHEPLTIKTHMLAFRTVQAYRAWNVGVVCFKGGLNHPLAPKRSLQGFHATILT